MSESGGTRRRRKPPFGALAYDWTQLGVPLQHHRLFVHHWDDLFSEVGLDTWQVRTSNVRTLLQEFVQATQVAEEYPPLTSALEDLIAETLGALERDEVIRRHYPFFRSALTELESMAKGGSRQSLSDCRRKATVLLGRIDDYRNHAISDLRTILRDEGSKEKERQLRLTMAVATEFVASGYSLRHLKSAGELLRASKKPFVERFDDLVSACDGNPRLHAVYFAVQQWPAGVPIGSKGPEGSRFLTLDSQDLPIPTSAAAKSFLTDARPDCTIAEVRVASPDPFSARRDAETRLSSAIAAIAFACLNEPTLKIDEALVVGPDGATHVVPRDTSRRKYLKPSHDWETRTAALIGLYATLPSREAEQLNATLQYYRLAISHQTDEVRVVNMWVATENLVSSIPGMSIIDRVSEFLVPVIASRNIRGVARGLARELGARLSFRQLRGLGLLEQKKVPPLTLLNLLRNDAQATALLALLDDNPLLRHRLSRFASGALKDGKATAGYLEAHSRNVKWQLRRIYRARNSIVHRGQAPTTLRQLLQHLHAYLWIAIRSLTTDLAKARGAWTIADALEHRRSHFRYMLDVLRASGTELPVEALIEPDLFLQMPVSPSTGQLRSIPGRQSA